MIFLCYNHKQDTVIGVSGVSVRHTVSSKILSKTLAVKRKLVNKTNKIAFLILNPIRSVILSLVTKCKIQSKNHQRATSVALVAVALTIGLMVARNNVNAVGDLNLSWNFSNPAQFTKDAGLETYGNSIRLKAQNYTTDMHTSALFHFDESNGTTATDDSGNSNDAVIENGIFGSGNLNNGLALNGTDSFASVPSSTSLSLTQTNTLEGWTKLNENLSAGNRHKRQSIIDKGDYQLYYDNETGKVTYELANNNATQWTPAGGNDINGSWDQNGKRSVNAISKIGSDVYAALGVDVGDAEVWKWDGTTWSKIGGGPESINNSWSNQTYEGVYTLENDGTNLYAGLGLTAGDGEVWKYDGTNWSKIGGDGINNGWAISLAEQIWSLNYFGGKLYAGIGSSANDAEVWSWNGTTWSKIGGDSLNNGWTTNYEDVAALTNDGTNLYAGLGVSAGDSEVWKWDGTTWSKIGGDGVGSSWGATIETVRSLRYFGTKLYAGLGDSANDAEVWVWDGTTWSKIGGTGTNNSWPAGYEQISAFAYDGTNVYAGLGTSNGDGEVWKWDGTTWSKIGGDTLDGSWTTNQGDTINTLVFDNGKLYSGSYDSAGSGLVYEWDGNSWSQIGGDYVNKSWGFYGVSAVQVLQNVGDSMYAGLGNTAGSAMVWKYDGNQWQMIGGQGINGSWDPNTYEQVMSMASYNGHLFVGLGVSANDAEVWEYDGATWAKVGGDNLNNGWAANFESVNAMASYGGYLYAGLGASANDAEVWRYNGSNWSKIGGDSVNNGWTTNFENVMSLGVYKGKLIAGLGSSTGDGEVWEWNVTTWSRIGGDGVANSWSTSTYQTVESIIIYGNDMYVGMGSVTGSATAWKYDGTSWSQVGGDDLNASWTAGTYEKVKTMAVYNGDLYAGLGNTAGDGEVWKWNGITWVKVGGNSTNSGWTNVVEEVESFSAYKGKFYAGTGLSTNVDGLVWSLGDNSFLQSSQSSFDTNWHHIAGTYDGTTMKIYIDGVEDSSRPTTVNLAKTNKPLLIGTSYGGREYGKPTSSFDGELDEVRISDIARNSFTTRPYSSSPQAVSINTPVWQNGVWYFNGMTSDESTNGGSISYRLSDDNGSNWKYWDGSVWSVSANTNESNNISDVNAHITDLSPTVNGLKWQAILSGNGNQQVTLNTIAASATSDSIAPATNASGIIASKTNGGASLPSNGWTNSSSPYFSWSAGTDAQSGIKGYCLYLGDDMSADPLTTKGMLGSSPIDTGGTCQFAVSGNELDLATSGILAQAFSTSNDPYYLLIKAIDKAGNTYATTTSFNFRFDNTPPTNPNYISGPSGFINTKQATLTWPTSGPGAPVDNNSGIIGLQYKIGSSPWYGSSHTGTGDINDLLVNNGSYETVASPDFANLNEGVNTVSFRTWDNAGNVTTSYVTAALKINTSGAPSEPQNLSATPATNTINSYSFDWDAPSSFVGDQSNLSYCYTVNVAPSVSTCTFLPGGSSSLGSGPYATQPGINTLYVVARDESNNINYSSYSTVDFTSNTTAPGVPLNVDIVDVSIKSTSNWRLALTWDPPSNLGAGISSYKIYRSVDNSSFNPVGSSSSTTYIDAGLSQQTYYYHVKACDSTNNCGIISPSVNDIPTGKFTSPATLVAPPQVSDLTTRKAKITWSTDRASDSKIALGTQSGKYNSSEIANSSQVSAHVIALDNLSAGTTYYYVARWTDADGNTGQTQESSFTTPPPPSLGEVSALDIRLSGATVQFTSTNATKVAIYYGATGAFGGVKIVNTSTSKSTYTTRLENLDDGTKYLYKLVTYDSDGNTYEGNTASFSTPPRPRITNVRFQPVNGQPTSTQRITWNTNVPSSSLINYGLVGTPGSSAQTNGLVTSHSVTVSYLKDNSQYFLIAQSRDGNGNLATSDRQIFRTALDTRPPMISNVTVQPSIRGNGAEARGQVVVSWSTDEPATSQVAYAEGSTSQTTQTTSQDGSLSYEHVVIVSNLPTSRVYSLVPISADKSNNISKFQSQTTVIGKASDNVMTIVLSTLKKVFGF